MLDRLRTVGYAVQAGFPVGFALLPWKGYHRPPEKGGVGKAVPEEERAWFGKSGWKAQKRRKEAAE